MGKVLGIMNIPLNPVGKKWVCEGVCEGGRQRGAQRLVNKCEWQSWPRWPVSPPITSHRIPTHVGGVHGVRVKAARERGAWYIAPVACALRLVSLGNGA